MKDAGVWRGVLLIGRMTNVLFETFISGSNYFRDWISLDCRGQFRGLETQSMCQTEQHLMVRTSIAANENKDCFRTNLCFQVNNMTDVFVKCWSSGVFFWCCDSMTLNSCSAQRELLHGTSVDLSILNKMLLSFAPKGQRWFYMHLPIHLEPLPIQILQGALSFSPQ